MTKLYYQTLVVAGVFCLVGTLLTFLLVLQHLNNFQRPELQIYIIRIVLMAPFYSVTSYISLAAPSAASFLNTLRDIYESYTLFNFFNLLLMFLGGSSTLIHILADKPTMKHLYPVNRCFPSYKPSYLWLRRIRQGIIQYAFIMPLTAIVALVLALLGTALHRQSSRRCFLQQRKNDRDRPVR